MLKKYIALFVVILFTISLTGCGSEKTEDNNSNDSSKEKTNSSYTFDNLKTDLTKLDSNIKITKKAADMIGAEEGYGYIMSNCSIEVYRFNKSSEEYTKAEKEQKINMPSMGMSFDATVKNGYAYSITEGNCDEALKYVEKIYK